MIFFNKSSGLILLLHLKENSITLLKKIGPELNGIGLVIQILDLFFTFKSYKF